VRGLDHEGRETARKTRKVGRAPFVRFVVQVLWRLPESVAWRLAAQLWGLTDAELREIQESLAERG
jgi:hypothetical protein